MYKEQLRSEFVSIEKDCRLMLEATTRIRMAMENIRKLGYTETYNESLLTDLALIENDVKDLQRYNLDKFKNLKREGYL